VSAVLAIRIIFLLLVISTGRPSEKRYGTCFAPQSDQQ